MARLRIALAFVLGLADWVSSPGLRLPASQPRAAPVVKLATGEAHSWSPPQSNAESSVQRKDCPASGEGLRGTRTICDKGKDEISCLMCSSAPCRVATFCATSSCLAAS